mgnify:CR=1 FL=1
MNPSIPEGTRVRVVKPIMLFNGSVIPVGTIMRASENGNRWITGLEKPAHEMRTLMRYTLYKNIRFLCPGIAKEK